MAKCPMTLYYGGNAADFLKLGDIEMRMLSLALIAAAFSVSACNQGDLNKQTASVTSAPANALSQSTQKVSVMRFCMSNNQCILIDMNRSVALTDKAYSFIGKFDSLDLAGVRDVDKHGYINKSGKLVIPAIFEMAGDFAKNGLALVTVNGQKAFIDKNGAVVIPAQDGNVSPFADAGLALIEKDKKAGFINAKGEIAIPLIYDWASNFSSDGLARVKKDGKEGMIDMHGKTVIPLIYDSLSRYSDNGLAHVANNYSPDPKNPKLRFSYINRNNQVSISIPDGFEVVYDFSNGLAKFIKCTSSETDFFKRLAYCVDHAVYGYINDKGQIVIPASFEMAYDFSSNGLAKVKQHGKWGFVGKDGEMKIKAVYEEAWDFSPNGLAMVGLNGKYGYINRAGAYVIPAVFDMGNDFTPDGYADVEQNGRKAIIEQNGRNLVYEDLVCNTHVVKSAVGQIIWPRSSVAEICAQADYDKLHSGKTVSH